MNVNLGIRKLSPVNGAFIMTIPIVAVRTFGWKAYDKLSVTMTEEGSLIIEKDASDIYD